jgi:hypothetical protein
VAHFLSLQCIHSYDFLRDVDANLSEVEYPCFCVLCGHHPEYTYCDANKNTAFDLKSNKRWKTEVTEAKSAVNIGEFWHRTAEQCFLRHRSNQWDSSSSLPLNKIGNPNPNRGLSFVCLLTCFVGTSSLVCPAVVAQPSN